MLITRIKLEEKEEKNLAPYAVKNKSSKGRKHSEPKDKYRLEFQRDRDRIIHCRAFRRLKGKTQVFVSHFGDHYRSRLTHTMEVAQISRDIARNLSLNEDLAESIALAHDLGHPPFGHAGEETLNKLMQKFGKKFEHNLQSRRIIELLEKKYPSFPGLNLTYEVIEGLMKHFTPYDENTSSFSVFPSLEAQVVNISDEIAYQNHDLDDGWRSGILKENELRKLSIVKKALKKINSVPPSLIRGVCVNKIINMMITDVLVFTDKNIKRCGIKNLKDVYKKREMIVNFSPKTRDNNRELREFLFTKMYYSPSVRKQSERGQKIIEFLFGHYLKFPPKHILPNVPIHIAVKDYIAGMTDNFAEAEFKN